MDSNSECSDSDGEDWKEKLYDNNVNVSHLSHGHAHTPKKSKTKSDLLEIKKDHSHTIVHIDIDCFYAQVEMIRNPQLREKPLGIQQKNIIVTCNYVARQHGVTKLMYLTDALKKCPQLHIVNGENLTNYREMSYKITALLSKYSCTVERLGFDENFIDVTEMLTFPPWNAIDRPPPGFVYGKESKECSSGDSPSFKELPVCHCGCTRRLTIASHIAADMRKSLHQELGITSCAGVGYNKLLAKLVGETHKPNQQTVLYARDVNQFMLGLQKLRKIPGFGHKTCEKFASLGITSVQELQDSDMASLVNEFGEQSAKTLKDLSFGIDPSPVVKTGKPQSMSDEDSFKKCDTVEDAKAKMLELVQNLLKRLEVDGRIAQTLRVTVRKLVPGVKYPNRQSRQGPIPASTFTHFLQGNAEKTEEILLELCFKLFQKLIDPTLKFHLTLINICFASLVDPSVGSSTGTIENFFKSPLKPNCQIKPLPDRGSTTCERLNEVKDKQTSTQSSPRFKLESTKVSSSNTGVTSLCWANTKKQDSHLNLDVDAVSNQNKNASSKASFKVSKSPESIKSFFQQRIANTAKHETKVSFDQCSDISLKHTHNEFIPDKNKLSKDISTDDGNSLSLSNNIIRSFQANVTQLCKENNKSNNINSDNDLASFHEHNIQDKNVLSTSDSVLSLQLDCNDSQYAKYDKMNSSNNITQTRSMNDNVEFNNSRSKIDYISLGPENYRLLVKHLGSCMDICTFLELPQLVQEDIILQQENLSKDDQQILLNIVSNKSMNDIECKSNNFVSAGSSCDVQYDNVQDNTASSSLLDNETVTEEQFCAQISSTNQDSISVPPGMDPNVFKELPADVQRSLYNDWKTKSEFESMRKRKLSAQPEINRSTKKRTSISSIKSFFQSK